MRLEAPNRITGLDTARAVAILGMIATHIFPLLQTTADGTVAPTWVGMSLTGVSAALFVVLAGVGISLLTSGSTSIGTSRIRLSLRAITLIFIGLLLGHAGSHVAIILVHYGVLFLMAMWFIALSRRALTITAVVWLIAAPFVHGVFTRFMHLQAGGTTAYAEDWRLWTSPNLADLMQQPLLTLWDVLFTGYYPVISFLGYVLVGMAIGRYNLRKAATGGWLAAVGTVTYLLCRGYAAWLLTDPDYANRIAQATGTPVEQLGASAATGSMINTDLIMGAPEWFGLAIPHSGAPLDIVSTAGAASAAIGVFLLITRAWLGDKLLLPLSATGMIALTAYVAHVLLTGLWPTQWTGPMPVTDPMWSDVWIMLLVHWAMVIALGIIVYLLGVRGPLEALLRNISQVATKR